MRVKAWWYSPRDGQTYTAKGQMSARLFITLPAHGEREFKSPGAVGDGNDWVLVLDDARKSYPLPGKSK